MTRRWSDTTIPSPPMRVLRTAFQAIVAVLVAIPAATALLDLPADTTAKISGFAGAAVVVISAIQNAIEAKTGKTVLGTRRGINTPEEG